MPLDHFTHPDLDAAWQATLARLPDRHELSPYQIARARDLFTAGWLAALNAGGEGREPAGGKR